MLCLVEENEIECKIMNGIKWERKDVKGKRAKNVKMQVLSDGAFTDRTNWLGVE